MIKKLARFILKNEIKQKDQFTDQLLTNEDRLNDLVNKLNKENYALRNNRLPREYAFAPEFLTAEEQEIIGDYVETPIIDLITKWFKAKADQNNDLLLHNTQDPAKQEKFKLAVLMYDDWRMFIKNCQNQFDRRKEA